MGRRGGAFDACWRGWLLRQLLGRAGTAVALTGAVLSRVGPLFRAATGWMTGPRKWGGLRRAGFAGPAVALTGAVRRRVRISFPAAAGWMTGAGE
jgi:hypothetical protein